MGCFVFVFLSSSLLVEFRTRKAHRWVVRDKDLLKYWAVMVTCVLVYLSSGTMSTLQHSGYSPWSWASGNNTRTLLLPKETTVKAENQGIPVRNGPKMWQSNASFLLQKARVLRRESELVYNHNNSPTSASYSVSEASGEPVVASSSVDPRQEDSDLFNATDDPIGSSPGDPSLQSNRNNCDPALQPLGISILMKSSELSVSFPVCRQLWWQYVSVAGES